MALDLRPDSLPVHTLPKGVQEDAGSKSASWKGAGNPISNCISHACRISRHRGILKQQVARGPRVRGSRGAPVARTAIDCRKWSFPTCDQAAQRVACEVLRCCAARLRCAVTLVVGERQIPGCAGKLGEENTCMYGYGVPYLATTPPNNKPHPSPTPRGAVAALHDWHRALLLWDVLCEALVL